MLPLSAVRAAAALLAPRISRTPLIQSSTFSRMFGRPVWLKLENLQKTGSFKLRGATYKILRNLDKIDPQGVVAASAGNHAQGVALAASQAGVPATIVMPAWASLSKQEATKGYGGRVVIAGASVEESVQAAQELAHQGLTFIHPFDDEEIMAGQGTVALEILESLPEAAAIIAPVGGGGLIAGLASAAKALKPGIRIIGVQAQACPSALEARRQGRPVRVEARPSLADGISVKQAGARTFAVIQESVDELVAVDEERLAEAVLLLLERAKLLVEGAGAVPLAALLAGAAPLPTDGPVVLVVSGGNVDLPLMDRIIIKGLVNNGRLMRFRVNLADTPGQLARLLETVAQAQANVLHIRHDRHVREQPIYVTRVFLEVETRGPAHIEELTMTLRASGYEPTLA